MNPFDAYADETGYRGLPKRQEKIARGPSELEKKEQEAQRLAKSYRAWKRSHAKSMLTAEPRLKAFKRYLRKATDGDEMLADIRDSWLPASPVDVRIFALRMVDARCQKIRLSMGLDALDDPLPPETSVYFEARDLLYPGARG